MGCFFLGGSMAQFIAVYGKGGIGKSTTVSHMAVCFRKKGLRVLQIGCDPKHDSTYSVVGKIIPTVSETLLKHNFHSENISPDEIVHTGYLGVCVIELGGPPAGVGCGGYVIGEGIQLISTLHIWENFDIVLFDVLGDVVCGGFSIPLQYAHYTVIVLTDDFDSLYAANRIAAAIKEKAQTYPVQLLGIIANKCVSLGRIENFSRDINTPVISIINDSELVKKARAAGMTIFEISEKTGVPIPSVLSSAYETIVQYCLDNAQESRKNDIRYLADTEMFSRYMVNNRSHENGNT